MTTTAPVSDETRSAFLAALERFGKDITEERQKGELALNQIPRDLRTQLALETWQSYRKTRYLRQYGTVISLLLSVIVVAISLITFIAWKASKQFRDQISSIWPLFLMFPTLISLKWAPPLSDREMGNIRLLTMLDSPKVLPSLLEITTSISPLHDHRASAIQVATRQRLTELIPRFLKADLPHLNERHQKLIRSELQLFANRVRWKSAPLIEWETEYLVALLSLLHLPKRGQARNATHSVLESMAQLDHSQSNTGEYLREIVQETQTRLSVGATRG